jgi:hypothetical protein
VALMASASVASAQSTAPALTYVQVRYVDSSDQGQEAIADSATSTTKNHGGAQLRVLTVEMGLGNNRVATINGSVLPATANYSTTPFCSLSFTTPCSVGQTVVGQTRWWKIDGYQSGTFSYRTTSVNSPYNTLTDTLTIL